MLHSVTQFKAFGDWQKWQSEVADGRDCDRLSVACRRDRCNECTSLRRATIPLNQHAAAWRVFTNR